LVLEHAERLKQQQQAAAAAASDGASAVSSAAAAAAAAAEVDGAEFEQAVVRSWRIDHECDVCACEMSCRCELLMTADECRVQTVAESVRSRQRETNRIVLMHRSVQLI
jgi:hypothetical protein